VFEAFHDRKKHDPKCTPADPLFPGAYALG
jgi:hypothetical protein